jgi:DNA-binding NtrC family response regulator
VTDANHPTTRTILVADDEPVMRNFCASVLRKHSYTTICAENGMQALDLYKENLADIALVLTDTSMPVMNGVALVRKLLTFNPECKIILMTGYDVMHTLPADLKLQCPRLVKPFSSAELIGAVRRCLGVPTP